MIASILGKMDLIEMLLQSTANIAIKDRLGKTSLFHAVEGGNISIIRKLITAGSDVNEIDNSNRTPLIYACLKGDVSSIGDLLAAGANVHRKDIVSIKFLCCVTCCVEYVLLLLFYYIAYCIVVWKVLFDVRHSQRGRKLYPSAN